LLDPISRDSEIKSISRELIQKVDKFARNIEDKTSKRVNIVGSFSKCHNKTRYDNLDEIFEYLYRTNTNILPQWLPVFAWYFGGSVKLDLFNSYEDIKYIKSNGCKICLDLSHLVMASCHYNASWKLWYEELLPFVEHLHISDAADATSEGLMFGDGMIGDFSNILSVDKLKIIECWQGHINEGEGFRQSLDILYRQSREGNV
jgi:N-acetylneuraminate synthase